VTDTRQYPFHPGLMPAVSLEESYLHDAALPDRIMGGLLEPAAENGGPHLLIRGPWGVGKSHLLHLLYHRLRYRENELFPQPVVLLSNSAGAVMQFSDLLRCMLAGLRGVYSEEAFVTACEALKTYQGRSREQKMRELLLETSRSQNVLYLIDDFDAIAGALDKSGRRKLGVFLKENRHIPILAAAAIYPEKSLDPLRPLYGNFIRHDLEPLPEAALPGRCARWLEAEGNGAGACFMRSARGKSWCKALYHLFGGVPRFHVLFCQSLKSASADGMAGATRKAVSALSPWYGQLLETLSPQQRKLFVFLCQRAAPATVKEIADENGLTSQSASSQLKTLRSRGLVRAESAGRTSFYEAESPLIRFGLALGGLPRDGLGLSLSFYSAWFQDTALKESVPLPVPHGVVSRDFLLKPLVRVSRSVARDEAVGPAVHEYVKHAVAGDHEEALSHAEWLVENRGRPWDWLARLNALLQLRRWQDMEAVLETFLESNPGNSLGWGVWGVLRMQQHRYEDALAMFDRCIRLEAKNFDEVWTSRAAALIRLGRYWESIASCDEALKHDNKDPMAWYMRALSLAWLDAWDEVLADIEKVLAFEPRNGGAWTLCTLVLYRLSRNEEALEAAGKAVEYHPDEAVARALHGALLREAGDLKGAREAFEAAFQRDPHDPFILLSQGLTLFSLGEWEPGLDRLQRGMRHLRDGDPGLLAGITRALLRMLFTAARDGDTDRWERIVPRLRRIYGDAHHLDILGAGLVATIAAIGAPESVHSRNRRWRDLWREAGADQPALELPIRMLDAGVRYCESLKRQDVCGLMQEDRSLVETLCNLR
jgi:tetratricopeptide (TPR) repeat protein